MCARYTESLGYLFFFVFLRVDERSSDSYIGSDEFFLFFFFSGKNLKFVQAQIHFFCGSAFDFFKYQFISFVKRKANSTIKYQRCKGHEKCDRLQVLKVEFNFRISL